MDVIVAALRGKTCVGAFDAISSEKTLGPLCDILHRSGARKVVGALAPGAEAFATNDVEIRTNFAARNSETAVGPQIWRTSLEPALVSGALLYKPEAEVVGHGLENVQKAIDLLAQGVSAKEACSLYAISN